MRAPAGPQGLVTANLGGGNGPREALGTAPGKHQLQRGVCWALLWGKVSPRTEEGLGTWVRCEGRKGSLGRLAVALGPHKVFPQMGRRTFWAGRILACLRLWGRAAFVLL